MASQVSISALVLAGGRATRMGGIPKHELVVQGETILARQARILRASVGEVLVSAPADISGFGTVRDAPEHAGIGPLAGIAAGLAAATTEWLFVVAGDMPYLSALLVGHMLELVELAGGRSEDDAAPRWEGVHAIGVRKNALPEPLFSMLRVRRARAAVAAMIAAGDFKASHLLDALGAAYVAEQVARACDPELRALHNINEPGDLR